MVFRDDRAPVWAIWLLIAFGAVQPLIWTHVSTAVQRRAVFIPILIVWITLLVLAALATRRVDWLVRSLTSEEQAHRTTLNEVEQLQTQNAILEIVTRSVDVPLAFQELASRIARLVPCDRVGLALLAEDGKEFQTYTARVQSDDGPRRARPEVVFKVERTMIGGVVRSREPLVVDDMNAVAPDYLDANVVVTAGFRSALIIPLVANERAVGTLNLVARKPGVFDRRHVEPLQEIAEILAVTWVAQQLQQTVGKHRMAQVMSEATLSVAAEINSALQTIVGHCDLLMHTSEDPGIKRDISTVSRQAQRIAELLEKMRSQVRDSRDRAERANRADGPTEIV
jgi:transcriptional regulator with GAF, ATPase, and Fis domain